MNDAPRPQRINPTLAYGRGADLQMRLGIDILTGEKLAGIVIFGANIENYLEQAIWEVRGVHPRGTRPDTDAKPITELIAMLAAIAETIEPSDRRTMLETWCKAAVSGFTIRNNIAHGISFRMEGTVAFMRNGRWNGISRKRPFGDLWAEPGVLDMIRDSFAVLLRVIHAVTKGEVDKVAADPLAVRALREARSILGEFASQTYNPSFEKY